MSSTYGKNIKISLFGQSHSEAIGVVIDGLPSGFRIDFDQLQRFMARRAPGQNNYSTPRNEPDELEVLSGLADGITCGAPFCAIIRNKDTHSSDYNNLRDIPRPAHADFAAQLKYKGAQDVAGGGHFSGRLTAPLCIAGGICLQLLNKENIQIAAHIASIGTVHDDFFDPVKIKPEDMNRVTAATFPVINQSAGAQMISAVAEAKKDGDSLGGIIECAAIGIPGGLGDPMFDGIENRIAGIIFGIPAVKGIEFGNGFGSTVLRGSENNDAFCTQENLVRTHTNNHGGILGGITSGMPIIFRVAIKPTPSIAKEQRSVSLSGKTNVTLSIKGRHDPCIVPRAVPCVEAAAAIALYDALLEAKQYI